MSRATSDSVKIDHQSQEIYCGTVAVHARLVANILIQLVADNPQLAPFSWTMKRLSPILRRIGTRDLQPPLPTNDMDLGV
jgi:hypothetical protein